MVQADAVCEHFSCSFCTEFPIYEGLFFAYAVLLRSFSSLTMLRAREAVYLGRVFFFLHPFSASCRVSPTLFLTPISYYEGGTTSHKGRRGGLPPSSVTLHNVVADLACFMYFYGRKSIGEFADG